MRHVTTLMTALMALGSAWVTWAGLDLAYTYEVDGHGLHPWAVLALILVTWGVTAVSAALLTPYPGDAELTELADDLHLDRDDVLTNFYRNDGQ